MTTTFDLGKTLSLALQTVGYLSFIIMALVQYFGKLGLTGRAQLVSSMVAGLVLGGLVMYAQIQPKTLADYLVVVITGLIAGLTASGVYEVGKGIAARIKV